MPDALQAKGRRIDNASSPIERKFSDPDQSVFLLLRNTSPIVHLIHKGFLRVPHAACLNLIDRVRHEFGSVDCTMALEGVFVVILGTSDACEG